MRNYHTRIRCLLMCSCLCLVTSGSSQEKVAQKNDSIKLVIVAKDMVPSQLPPRYTELLDPMSPKCLLKKDDVLQDGFMAWSFFVGTLNPKAQETRENMIFFIATNPNQIRPMMDDMKNLDQKLTGQLAKNPQAVLVGRDQLAKMKKRVGDKFKVTSFNFEGIALEFEIIGELPHGRFSHSAIMHEAYLKQAFEGYEKQKGKAHPNADKCINLMWLRVPNQAAYERVKTIIEKSPEFKDIPLQCDTELEAAKKLQQK